MTMCDFRGKVIKGTMVSVFLSLGPLALGEARGRVVRRPRQPYEEIHVVRNWRIPPTGM